MFMGANGVLVKERISLCIRMYAKLVKCLRSQMVPLSRNGLHLAFDCMLNWLMLMGANGILVNERISLVLRLYTKLVECLWVHILMVPLSRNGLHLAVECLLN